MKKSYTIYLLVILVSFGHFSFGQCAINLVATSTNITCVGCSNGSVSVSASGGTAPYTYLWTNNITPGTANIAPSKDNSIYEQTTGNSNGAGDYLVAGETAAGFKTRALMAFDIAANIPAGATINNVSLQLFIYLTSGTTGPQNHLLHRVDENWGEGTSFATQPGQGAPATTNDATWIRNFSPSSNWANIGGTFEPVESAVTQVNTSQTFYNWSSPTMVADVQAWLNSPSTNFGWLLRSEETGPKQAKRYASKENSTVAWRPKLTIQYGPAVIGTTSSVSNLAPGVYNVTVTDANNCTATAIVIISPDIKLPGIINTNTVLAYPNTYLIDGKVYVQNGATLFIDEGVVIKGVKKNDCSQTSALVITRSGRIEANGTNVNPIVFTSNQPVPAVGDWGGIVLLGSAPLNRADTSIAGIDPTVLPAGVDPNYGGGSTGMGNAEENKGAMRYIRIEYAGASVCNNNKLSSLTCAGIGRGTNLDFIQASYGGSDGFEWLGGTVNAKHLVSLANDDDSWNFNFGYNGHLQYLVSVLRLSKPTYSTEPNGIESDNNQFGSNLNPRTNATISNMTTIGVEDSLNASEYLPAPNSKRLLYSARLRRSTSFTIRNSIFMGYPTGVSFESAASVADVGRFQYNLLHGFRVTDLGASLDATNSELLGFVSAANDAVLLQDPFNVTSPDFRPRTAAPVSPAVSGANFTGFTAIPTNFFATNIAGTNFPLYKGAFMPGNSNWAGTWTRFF